MTVIGVTGADGFLGWHVRCRLLALQIDTVTANRATFDDDQQLDRFVTDSDVIIHCAGVNRASDDSEIVDGNPALAQRLTQAMTRTGCLTPVVYTNTTQSTADNLYGRSKQAASDHFAEFLRPAGTAFDDVVLPHLFGEFGRPNYNSAVITFAHHLATGTEPSINRDGQLELLHAQDAAQALIALALESQNQRHRIAGTPMTVGEAWDILTDAHRRYVVDGTIPPSARRIELQLFNMLRSQLYLAGFYPRAITQHADQRGAFSELVRADGLGQTSISTTVPGISRGDHFHFDKVERFVVVSGEATISLRRLFTNDVRTFRVSGDQPAFIDMPPLVTHNIVNVGDTTLATIFWAGDHFDPAVPDTYVEPVEARA